MPAPLALPEGYHQRPLDLADATAVFELMAAAERHDTGAVSIEEADIVADWQRPSYDLAAGSVCVLAGDVLVAYAELVGADRYDAAVHPDRRGLGIGTALAGWVRDLVAERGGSIVGMPVPQGSPGDRLLDALGYDVRWQSWLLHLPLGAEVADRPLPPGYAVRTAVADDLRTVHALQEDAFMEWSERDRESFEDWDARVTRRPGFEPWNLRVVADASGEVVAMALVLLGDGEAHVDRLATRADQRGRGLAQALLVDAFTLGREHGAVRSGLSTDSRTGALGLYEKVGMQVTSTWVHRATTV